MRTRFLNVDYFTSPHQTTSFLTLPLPHLPPPPSISDQHFLRLRPLPTPPLQIDNTLPIHSPLQKFISQVVPQTVHCPNFPNQINSPEDNDNETVTALDDKLMQKVDAIYFEEPEPNMLLYISEDEGKQISSKIISEIPEIENNLDLLRPGLEMQYFDNVQESIYVIEDITLSYDVDQSACELEDDSSFHDKIGYHYKTLPLLEVDETSLRIFANSTVKDQLLLFLENNEFQFAEKDNLDIDGMELLGSTQCNTIEFLCNHCLTNQCLESQLAFLDTILDSDIVSMVEALPSNEICGDCILPMSSVVFEEFKFHEVELILSYEVYFEKQTRHEPETCPWMFREDMNFKNFNELIVSCELAVIDDTFRSLPTPILIDDTKFRSLNVVAERVLSELKPLSLSASDGIYLDWHLLEEDKCNCKIYSYQNMMRELHTHSIDFDCESFDDGNLVIDFILFDDVLNCPKIEECKETLNMPYEGTSSDRPVGVASSNSLPNKYPKLGNGGRLVEENAGMTSLLLKSTTLFSDLDFFLNPRKAIAGVKLELAVKAPDANAKSPKEGDPNSVLAPNENMCEPKFEEMLNFAPSKDKYNMKSAEAGDKVETCCMPVPVPDMAYAMKSDHTQGGMESSHEIIIIVNTQNFDTEMIVSRRSSYHKILAMEKGGAQVIERDLDLPLDVITSSATCLLWYNCRNIGKKATTAYETSSCLPLCIENIATNVLTLLSFSFSSCILVFEGEYNFLSTVLESSDELYAAAASLGIDFQLFCSHSPDLTDDIILNSILSANKRCRGMYPRMPESETLAESFLTKFPSVNPLTAHAIISSGVMLMEFFGWSHKCRILAMQEYQVPVDSIALFNTLCRYGEREDSKSIMTDCSSSVSSGPDSGKTHFNVGSERKQRVDIQVDHILQPEPFNHFTGGMHDLSVVNKSYDCWLSADSEICEELKWPSSSLKDSLGQKQGIKDKPYDFRNPKCPLTIDETMLALNEELFGGNQGSEITSKKKVEWSKASKPENLHEEFVGEVIDLTESPLSGKGVSNKATSANFSPWLPEMEQDSARKSKAARRLSFGKNSNLSFAAAGGVSSDSDFWSSLKDDKQTLQEYNILSDKDINHDKVPLKYPTKLLEEGLTRQSAGFPFKEEISYYCGTPLSKAIHSADPKAGSPWTTEFLNKVREKSRLRQQSFPRDTTSPGFGYSGSKLKVNKRKSPSIIEFFKYQGGSTPGKGQEQKKQKQSMLLSGSSKNDKTSASLPPTWTPIDKRSTQTLSFAMNGSGSQTRLVWSDGTHHRRKKLQNQ